MRTIKKLLGAKKRPAGAEEIPVLETEIGEPGGIVRAPGGELEPIYLKSLELHSPTDVEKVGEELRAGNIVILDIASFMNRDVEELKRAIDQLKGVCRGTGGDVGRLGDSMIVATPKYVVIQFRKPAT